MEENGAELFPSLTNYDICDNCLDILVECAMTMVNNKC